MHPQKKQGILSEHKAKFLKILFTALFLLGVLLYFNSLLSWQILLVIAVFPFLFWGLRDRLWVFLVLAIPTLLLGKVLYFQVGSNWIYEARISEVLLLLAFAICVLDGFINRKLPDIKIDKILFIILVYLAFALLSFYQIVDFRYFIVGMKVISFSFIAYFLALNFLTTETSIRWFLRSVVLSVLILSVQIFVKFYQMGFSTKFFFERSTITIPLGPIALVAAVLAFLLPLVLVLFFLQKRWSSKKTFNFLTFLMGGMAVFLILGKAAILSAGLAFFYLFIRLKEQRMFFLIVGAWLLLLAAVFFTSFFAGLVERVSRTFVSENTQFRITEYQTGWNIIKDHFLTGVGAGQQLAYYKGALNWEDPQLVNNFFLQSFVELGVIGLGLVVSAVMLIHKKAKAKIKSVSGSTRVLVFGFVASFLVCFVNGLAEVTIFALPYAIIFWLVLGVFSNIDDQTFSQKII